MTIKTFALVSVFVLGSTVSAFAAGCSEPIAPAPVNGNTATLEQMKAATTDVKAFFKTVEEYQSCIETELNTARLEAKGKKKEVDPALVKATNDKWDSAQALKQKVGDEYNAAAVAYNKAHPAKPKS